METKMIDIDNILEHIWIENRSLRSKTFQTRYDIPHGHMFDYRNCMKWYHTENRHWHNENHIQRSLSFLNRMDAYFDLSGRDRDLIKAAIVFHDIIYDVNSKNNETASAYFWTGIATKMNFSKKFVTDVHNLIESTGDSYLNMCSRTRIYQILWDVDREVFKSAPSEYKIYSDGIEKEYVKVCTKNEYRRGRIKFLERTLYNSNIFFTLGSSYDMLARRNLEAELADLKRKVR